MSNHVSVNMSFDDDGNPVEVNPSDTRVTTQVDDGPRLSTQVNTTKTQVNIRGNSVEARTVAKASATTGALRSDMAEVFPGSVLATARSPMGAPVYGDKIGPKTVVTVDGMETTVAAAEQMGYLNRDAHGNYVDADVQARAEVQAAVDAENARQAQEDAAALAEFNLYRSGLAMTEFVSAGNGSLSGDVLLLQALRGQENDADYQRYATAAGIDVETAKAQAESVLLSTINELSAMTGIPADDVVEAIDHALSTATSAKQYEQALRVMFTTRNAVQVAHLLDGWKATQVPEREQLDAAGFQTRMEGEHLMVLVTDDNGSQAWVRADVAARLGFIWE